MFVGISPKRPLMIVLTVKLSVGAKGLNCEVGIPNLCFTNPQSFFYFSFGYIVLGATLLLLI
jgi:hypothetical protein